MIQRATVKPNASRAGWLVTSSDLASEPGLSMNGNSPVLRLAPCVEDQITGEHVERSEPFWRV